jgi:hypothetical protein
MDLGGENDRFYQGGKPPLRPPAPIKAAKPSAMSSSILLVVLLIGLGVLAAGAAVVFRYYQGRQAIELWGAGHASRIRNARQVTFARLYGESTPAAESLTDPEGNQWWARSWNEIGGSSDLVHIRQAFLRDAYLNPHEDDPFSTHWQYALRFGDDRGTTTMLIDGKGNEICLRESGAQATMNEGLLVSIRQYLDRQLPTQAEKAGNSR